jgi:hypothetical protein
MRRISVSGNNKTRDEVIRREFRQFEASWYDGQKIKLSRDLSTVWASSPRLTSRPRKCRALPTRSI